MIASDNIALFRKCMHVAFCGKENETSKCPEDCPVRKLTINNWGMIKIREMLEVKHGN